MNTCKGVILPASQTAGVQDGKLAGGASKQRRHVQLGILVMLALRLGFAALAAVSAYVAGSSDHDGVVLRDDSGASKHFMSDISLFHSLDEGAANVSFSTAAGTMIALRAVGTVKFKTKDDNGDYRIITLDNVYYVPRQQHNLVAVCQLTHCAERTWESPDFKKCTWQDATGVVYPFTYAHNEFIWIIGELAEFGETTCDGVVMPRSLATTRSITAGIQPILRPLGSESAVVN